MSLQYKSLITRQRWSPGSLPFSCEGIKRASGDGPNRGIRSCFFATCLALLLAAAGCDSRVDRFEPNEVYALTLAASRGVSTKQAELDVAKVIHDMFGTPDQPSWSAKTMPDLSILDHIRVESLVQSAGPVYSDRDGKNFGLFNKHCVNCHGLPGSGAGPASSFQNPYPRDFRAGIFKWKSTSRSAKPTKEDLLRTVHHGIPGSSMPSFALMSKEERTAVTEYAMFLAIRGETERRLLAECVDDLGYDEDTPADSLPYEAFQDQFRFVLQSWVDAKSNVVLVPEETDNDVNSVSRGKEIFHGPIANCVGCHGKDGNGDVLTLDYDDWTKEYSTRIGITPTDRDAMRPFRIAGAHRPRQTRPRKLSDGVFRGGGDSATLYRRISQGIAGTPMPSVSIQDQPSATGLTSDQVWDLVHYLQSFARSSDSPNESSTD